MSATAVSLIPDGDLPRLQDGAVGTEAARASTLRSGRRAAPPAASTG